MSLPPKKFSCPRPLWSAANAVFFALRSRLRWRRRGYSEVAESKTDLFAHLPPDLLAQAELREVLLRASYFLQPLHAAATRLNYLENLYLLDMLDQVWQEANLTMPEEPRILDVGPKNWYYVPALYRFFQFWGRPQGRPIRLTGIELDAHRVYKDWYSRYDYATYYQQGLEQCRYLTGDVLQHHDRYDIVLLLFPFVLEDALLHWGLPLQHFQPGTLLAHSLGLLDPWGVLLIVNQGADESRVQLDLLEQLGLRWSLHRRHGSLFMNYPEARYVTLVRRSDPTSSRSSS